MTTNESLAKDIARVEVRFDSLKVEMFQLTDKYLHGYNNILDNQNDLRASLTKLNNDLSQMEKRFIIIDEFIKKLEAVDCLDQIRKFVDHYESEKKLNLNSVPTKLSLLTILGFACAASLLTLLFTIIANVFFK